MLLTGALARAGTGMVEQVLAGMAGTVVVERVVAGMGSAVMKE